MLLIINDMSLFVRLIIIFLIPIDLYKWKYGFIKHFKKNIHRLKNVIGNVGLYKIGLVEKFFVITSI